MARINNAERITRNEERLSHLTADVVKREASCMVLFDKIKEKLEVVNREQGETSTAILSLTKTIEDNREQARKIREDATLQLSELREDITNLIAEKVKPPMSGRDRAIFYGTALTAICSLIGTLAIAYLGFLG